MSKKTLVPWDDPDLARIISCACYQSELQGSLENYAHGFPIGVVTRATFCIEGTVNFWLSATSGHGVFIIIQGIQWGESCNEAFQPSHFTLIIMHFLNLLVLEASQDCDC